MKIKLNQKGFSLVELMVVVAIIGILATIGIPQYQRFMAKARQSEAKTHLNAIFQGESSFFTEYNQYTTNVRAIGGGATGQGLRYNAGFTITACTAYTTANGAPPLAAATDNDYVSIIGAANFFYATITDVAAGVTACDSTAGAQVFTAAAWGNPTNTVTAGNNGDVFTINQLRVMSQTAIGL